MLNIYYIPCGGNPTAVSCLSIYCLFPVSWSLRLDSLIRPSCVIPGLISWHTMSRSLRLDFQLANTQERVHWLDMISPLEMLSPLLFECLNNLALGLLNYCRLDRIVLWRDIGFALNSIVLWSQFLDLVQLNNIPQLDVLEPVKDNNVILCDQVWAVLDLGHSIVTKLVTEQVDGWRRSGWWFCRWCWSCWRCCWRCGSNYLKWSKRGKLIR